MPRISLLGAACSQAFGLSALLRPRLVLVDYMIAGGGGNTSSYGGQAGGIVQIGSATISTIGSLSIVVGTAGVASSFNGVTAAGASDTAGHNGGSNPSYGGGSSAEWGWDDSTYTTAGGGGAGANQAGGNGSIADVVGQQQPTSGKGGDGKQWTVNGLYYGGGQQGSTYSAPGASQFGGGPGLGSATYGGGGHAGGVIVSYLSPIQLFTAGTVTSTGSGATKRWFHEVSATGTSALAPKY